MYNSEAIVNYPFPNIQHQNQNSCPFFIFSKRERGGLLWL